MLLVIAPISAFIYTLMKRKQYAIVGLKITNSIQFLQYFFAPRIKFANNYIKFIIMAWILLLIVLIFSINTKSMLE